MKPLNSSGWWCWFWYGIIVGTPPLCFAWFDLPLSGLVLFLLTGHVTLFSTCFYIAARLHCRP
jgi:hypothetical protein